MHTAFLVSRELDQKPLTLITNLQWRGCEGICSGVWGFSALKLTRSHPPSNFMGKKPLTFFVSIGAFEKRAAQYLIHRLVISMLAMPFDVVED